MPPTPRPHPAPAEPRPARPHPAAAGRRPARLHPAAAGPRPARLRSCGGQASVELVALVPLLVALVGLVWQAALAGHAVWIGSAAARASARAAAVGTEDPERVARRIAGATARVRTLASGAVRVTVPIPAVTGARLTDFTTTARFEPQR